MPFEKCIQVLLLFVCCRNAIVVANLYFIDYDKPMRPSIYVNAEDTRK